MQNSKPLITNSEANPTLLSSTLCVRWAAVNAVLLLETATQPEGGVSASPFLVLQPKGYISYGHLLWQE